MPRAKLQHQSDAQRLELQRLYQRKGELESRKAQLAAQRQRRAQARLGVERAEAGLRAFGSQSDLQRALVGAERELDALRGARAFSPPATDLTLVGAGAGFDRLLEDWRARRLDERLAAAIVGVVGDLGHVLDPWAADAVAALAGNKLQMFVVRTERDVDLVWETERYRGVRVMALENRGRKCPQLTRQGLIDLPRCVQCSGNRFLCCLALAAV